MYIYVAHKDPPELSSLRRTIIASAYVDPDTSVEKLLLVNPNCPVRIMLEYIRNQCKLAQYTQFDLCEENGVLKGLFSYQTYAYATQNFEHKKTYYLIVLRQESEKLVTVFPQVNHDNKLFTELQGRVRRYLLTGDASPVPAPQSKAGAKKK